MGAMLRCGLARPPPNRLGHAFGIAGRYHDLVRASADDTRNDEGLAFTGPPFQAAEGNRALDLLHGKRCEFRRVRSDVIRASPESAV